MVKVLRHIAGSYCVIERNKEHYIDCRKDVRAPHTVMIECVRRGMVYKRVRAGLCNAPSVTVQLIKEELCYG